MEGSRTSLWLFLLFSQLPFSPTVADQDIPIMEPYSYKTNNESSSFNHTEYPDTDPNGTRCDCLIDTEMGIIAVGSAGGLIFCFLVTTVVLACQVCYIQRRVYIPRTSRSNMDLVSSTGYWDAAQPEIQGLVGPCDASVMLEEVRADMEEDKESEKQEEREEAWEELKEGATAMTLDSEKTSSHIPTSGSRDSCQQALKDLEDVPLVV